jgi:hypothetical protein
MLLHRIGPMAISGDALMAGSFGFMWLAAMDQSWSSVPPRMLPAMKPTRRRISDSSSGV